jgi:hypothetical protein
MINTSIEITENDYLIKFSRSKFDLSFIRNLLTIVEISNPSEDHAIADKNFASGHLSSTPDYYSRLDEK